MTCQTDSEGYLLNITDWTPEIAALFANNAAIQLTPKHWTIINFVREYFLEYQIPPMEKIIVKYISLQKELMNDGLGDRSFSKQLLYELFPVTIPRELICQIGGLPKPTSCF